MALNVYESLIIFDSNKYARDAAGVSGAVSDMVGKIEGEVLADRLWVEQKLAFPIKGHRKGTYWLTYFRCDSQKLDEYNRLCQLNETILRHMVVKIEPRLVDAFVSHALGEKPADDKPAAEKPADEKPTEEKAETEAAPAETADA